MIWRLIYCNKNGAEARIDIIKGNRAPIEIVQGSGQPFTLSYKLDKSDKSGHIMTSSADIEIFETETFNIDDLKTSNETELKVEYFEENILTWSGFILPDFFSREIGSPNIVRMTASDRLTALKGITLSDLPAKVSLRDLIELSLAKTGLTLGLTAQVQLFQGSTNILDSEILSQRLTDVRGRSVSCYDILMSIMVGTNSTIRQRAGQWQVYNKLEHELRTPSIFFDKVEKGAIRTIQPVASSVGVYQEHGGGRSYPDNYDFSNGLTGWTAVNGFVATIDNRKVDNFISGTGVIPQEWTTNPVYGISTEKNYLVNDNYGINYDFADKPYLKSSNIPVTYPKESQINVNVSVNATGPFIESTTYRGETNFAVIASNGTKTFHLAASGIFETLKDDPFLHKVTFEGDRHLQAISSSKTVNGVLSVDEGDLTGYNITVRLYGYTKGVTGGRFLVTTLVNSVIVTFKNLSDAPKGNLYKTTQGSNFTKQHDVETTIFGDYITSGLNGYFYNYPVDDTSSLYLPNGELSSPIWITVFDATERPLLHHISRQKSRLFSVAHDILKANINVESFDPLAVFEDCKGGKYVVVSASFDFLRSEVNVDLEQIAYDNAISKRDFIYSYFGDGEDTIKSIGAITGGEGGSGGGGGGMTTEQLEMLANLANWWKLDAENDAIYSEKSVYSLKGVSALGLGSEGGGGGGDFDRLDTWASYDSTKAGWVLSALLGYDLHTRVNDLETNGGSSNIEIAITGSGNAVTGVSKSGNTLTFAKGSTFSLSNHNHNTLYKPIGYAPTWGEVTGKPSTFAPSAHTHTIANVTGLQSALNSKQNTLIAGTNITISGNTISASGGMSSVAWGDITGKPTTFAPSAHTHSASDITSGTLTIARIPAGATGTTVALGNHLHAGVYEPVFTKNDAFNKNFGTALGTVAQGNDSRIINGQTAFGWGNHASAGYALTTHNHSGVYEPVFTKNDAFNKNFGTALGTVAQGNDSRIINGQTAFGWGNHSSAGYALNTALTAHINKVDNPHAVTKAQVGLGSVDNTADSAKNVLSATKLTTARTIWGQSFNGTGNVSGALTGVTSISMNSALTGATTIEALTSITTPKVIFKTAGWSMEQSIEGVLELKYNGAIKQKFLNDGSIAATGELTAYVAGASGYSEFLPLSGGTLTGNLNIGTGVIIGTAAIPLSVRGSTFKYNNSDVLYKGNIGTASLPSIGLSDGWTIEIQTTPSSALLIKKNGVIKGTFNG